MRLIILGVLALGCMGIMVLPKTSLEQSQKRVKDHLLIKDYVAALAELKIYLAQFPQSQELQALMVRTLSESGAGLEAFKCWKEVSAIHQELGQDFKLIEAMAWAILEQAETSSQHIVNISSMIGASLTKDAKAVHILHRYLSSTNAYLRMRAVQLSAQYGDKRLIEEIKQMLHKETVWYVRLEVIRALGKFRCEEIALLLQEMLSNKKSTLEEMGVAAEALMTWYDHLEDQELMQLLRSKRAGLRYLGCEMIAYLGYQEKAEELLLLLEDTSSEVKIAALNTLCMIGIEKRLQKLALPQVEKLLEDPSKDVAIHAARLLMFYHPEPARLAFKKWIEQDHQETRRVAAAALARSGERGRELAKELLHSTEDAFVKVNLVYGMLGSEARTTLLCQVMNEFLIHHQGLIMIDRHAHPQLRVIAPSRIRHTPEIADYPKAVDQYTRLHLLNILAMMRYPQIEDVIKKYLKEQNFGMTYSASAALIEEGAEDCLEIIQALLGDEDPLIRVQAALVLALMGGDRQAIQVLEQAYPKVEREIKIHILEALGHLGARESIPFLLTLLDDPFNVMRIIAASSIIQCIYH